VLPETQKAWKRYWKSPPAEFITETDLPAVRRLFQYYDMHARALDLARQAPLVKGSAGQIKVNPLADHALKLEAAISRLEGELGITPAGRARLGLPADGNRRPTLDEINAKYRDEPSDRKDWRTELIPGWEPA
jgi:P27 family predicted phage terminase small subunit